MKTIFSLSRIPGWNAVPDQLKRILFIAVMIVTGYFIVRQHFIPETFYATGHFRQAALDSLRVLPMAYAGGEVCVQCHFDVGETKMATRHRGVSCEVCHGPGLRHAEEDPTTFVLAKPSEREFCTMCHGYNVSRPTGFPQIDPAIHNPAVRCMDCHNPHDPEPPFTPEDCSACHASIARTKSVSHHAEVSCVECHETQDEHKANPRANLPSIPQNRVFCSGCHGDNADSLDRVPKIDVEDHGNGYLCWQCHYPHYPEK